MRLLIFLLALMSAFFVSAETEPDLTDLKSPRLETGVHCFQNSYATSCNSDFNTAFNNACLMALSSYPMDETDTRIPQTNYCDGDKIVVEGVFTDAFGGKPYKSEESLRTQYLPSMNESYSCPPNDSPKYTIQVANSDPNTNPSFMCAKPLVLEDCPAGYHSKAVSAQIGGTECVLKECPPAGSGENLSSSPATGGVPFSGGGMYCNDGCAYSVPSSNITSQGYASGTSQGVSCGDKPYDNKKLADEGNEGGCKTTTDESGVSVMTCDTPADQPEGEDTDVDNGESKTDDTPTPKKPLEDCSVDDTACLLRNLQTSSENNKQDAIDNDNLLHNKLIDAITNNTNVIKNSVENLDTTVYLAQQENSRNDTIKIQKLDGIIDAIRGIEITGGGGGGTGSGGTGSGGDDCEGSADDCVPIADSELQVEQVNLDQYADKYDDWLPNAELPQEKCITLTTGNTMCLSFEFWIVLFQAISGLMVITALLHSAKIITGAV